MKSNKLFKGILLLILTTFFIGNVYSQTCPEDMVSYWKFEEVGDTAYSDYIGGHNATAAVVLANDPDGLVGNAKYFDGTKYAVVQDHADYSFPANSSFTVEFWVKLSDASFSGTNQVIMGQRDPSSSGPFWFVGIQHSSGKVIFEMQDGTGTWREVVSPSGIANGVWHHVVAIRDEATNSNLLYVDGGNLTTIEYDYSGSFDANDDITMGCFKGGSGIPSYFFQGSLDEAVIYDRALTSVEVSAHKTLGDNGIGYCDGYSPSFISVPSLKAAVGSPYSYTAHATGFQGSMNYSLLTKPTGMNINQTTGLITWTPTSTSQDGTVMILADNNQPPADTQSFRIFIAEAPDCPSNLSVLLNLNEGAGPIYADYYGTHDATASVSPAATNGIVEGGQVFNSMTKIDIPDIGDEFDWWQSDNFSIEFWMKTSTSETMVCVGRHRKAGDYDTLAAWWVGTNSSGEATFSLRDNNASPKLFEISGGSSLADNQWHHIIAVRQGSSSQENRLYVDGEEVASVSTNYNNSFRADIPTEINVGYWNRAHSWDNEYHFIGTLDEVAIHDRAITLPDAVLYYNGGNPTGHCAPGNYAPSFISDPVVTATQDILYTYNIEVDDVDQSDLLTVTAPSIPEWLDLSFIPGQKVALLSGTPANQDVEPVSVTLRVSDGQAHKDQIFTIDVENVNDPPSIGSTPDLSVDEDSLYSYTLIINDDDPSDVITMTPLTIPGWLTFSQTPGARTATLEGTPEDADEGDNPIDISITDGTVTINETYTLVVNAVNDAPIISDQRDLSIDEDQTITLVLSDFTVDDEDNTPEQLTLSVQAGNDYTYFGNEVTPLENFFGTLTVPVVVSDQSDDSEVFNTIITVNPINDPPVITSIPDLTVNMKSLYAYAFVATDADGDPVSYKAVDLPGWLQFSASTGILTGTPQWEDRGEHLIVLSATDGTEIVDDIFTITVGTNAIADVEEQSFRVYPVPAKEVLYLEFAELSEETVINIYSSIGVIMKSLTTPGNTEKLSIEISELDAGAYYCVLKNNSMHQTVKFVVSE